MTKWLIVGAGLTGATLAERIATVLGDPVTVIDKRAHVAGNSHDCPNEHGVLVHKYGPHIFHTNSTKVWDYLSQFTEWRPYAHRVLAELGDQQVPVPFNLTTLRGCFNGAEATKLEQKLVGAYGLGGEVPVLSLIKDPDPALAALGKFIYDKIFYGYTLKQWGRKPEDLDPAVTGRVPVRVSADDRYFTDRHQALPKLGYTSLVNRMLRHQLIEVHLGLSYDVAKEIIEHDRLIFTGPIDEYFDHVLGALPYRSLEFKLNTVPVYEQAAGTVNFPSPEVPYTRQTDMSWLTGPSGPQATQVTEYPRAHEPGVTEPYYPVPCPESRELYRRYQELADKLGDKVLFAGRLGSYRYYNMDQAVAAALSLFQKKIMGGQDAGD